LNIARALVKTVNDQDPVYLHFLVFWVRCD